MSRISVSFGPVLDGNDRYVPYLSQMEKRLCVFSDEKTAIACFPESCQTGIYHHVVRKNQSHYLRFVTEDRTGEREFRFMRVIEDLRGGGSRMQQIYVDYEGQILPLEESKDIPVERDPVPWLLKGPTEKLWFLSCIVAETTERAVSFLCNLVNQGIANNLINREIKAIVKRETGKKFRSARKAARYYENWRKK